MKENLTQARLRIRPMALEDVAQVIEIDQLSFTLPWPKNAFRHELTENPNSRSYIAELSYPGGKTIIVGLCVVWLILDEAHIATLATHPEHRRQGIAQKMLITVLTDCIEYGSISATLEVRATNQAAHALYQKFGFNIVGSRPKYYQDNQEDALIMTLSGLNRTYLETLKGFKFKDDLFPIIEQSERMRSID